jgi:transposase InsO family protein
MSATPNASSSVLDPWQEEVHVKRLIELCHGGNALCDPPPATARGFNAQRDRRALERDLRGRVVDFVDSTHRRHGWSMTDIAIELQMAPRTLRQWFADFQQTTIERPRPLPLGRPAIRSSRDDRQAVLAVLDELGPATGLPTLQDAFPNMPRAELHNLLVRYRAVLQKRYHHAPHTLTWTVPGSVWAIDFSEAPAPVDGIFPYLLAVRDLASHQQLLWTPVASMTADSAIAGLSRLVARHGAPLVLKSDNGSAFIADEFQNFLASAGVFALYSPPRTPRYNGSIEAGIGSLKTRTDRHAQRQGRPTSWSADDLAFAQAEANATARPQGPRGPTPDDLWSLRNPITDSQRTTFAETIERHRRDIQAREGHPTNGTPTTAKERLMDRDAIRRALVEHDFLLFSRRRLPLTIRSQKTAEIM